jgi:hypothetical protein
VDNKHLDLRPALRVLEAREHPLLLLLLPLLASLVVDKSRDRNRGGRSKVIDLNRITKRAGKSRRRVRS